LAQLDPSIVLDGQFPRLIDEWQEVPSLWDAVRFKVDDQAVKGQFILTGSATPKRRGVMHSGTGRIARLRMMSMSLYESGDSTGFISLKDICNSVYETKLTGEVQLRTIAALILRGGWPGSIGLSTKNAVLIPRMYLKNVVDDDVDKIDEQSQDEASVTLSRKKREYNCRKKEAQGRYNGCREGFN